MIKVCMLLLVATIAFADTASQTDWSGGDGVPGPVLHWGETFNTAMDVNWFSSSGDLQLDYAPPILHSVWETYVRVNQAFPVDMEGDGDTDILGAAGRYSPPYFLVHRVFPG